jgi:hypothetical protein
MVWADLLAYVDHNATVVCHHEESKRDGRLNLRRKIHRDSGCILCVFRRTAGDVQHDCRPVLCHRQYLFHLKIASNGIIVVQGLDFLCRLDLLCKAPPSEEEGARLVGCSLAKAAGRKSKVGGRELHELSRMNSRRLAEFASSPSLMIPESWKRSSATWVPGTPHPPGRLPKGCRAHTPTNPVTTWTRCPTTKTC